MILNYSTERGKSCLPLPLLVQGKRSDHSTASMLQVSLDTTNIGISANESLDQHDKEENHNLQTAFIQLVDVN